MAAGEKIIQDYAASVASALKQTVDRYEQLHIDGAQLLGGDTAAAHEKAALSAAKEGKFDTSVAEALKAEKAIATNLGNKYNASVVDAFKTNREIISKLANTLGFGGEETTLPGASSATPPLPAGQRQKV